MKKRTSSALVGRVLSRLSAAEAEEIDPWLRDDLRIARLTVAYAATGEAVGCSPDVLASYMVLGLHPEKVWPAIQARRMALSPGLEAVGDVLLVPKKPAQSVKLPRDMPLVGTKKPAQSVKLWCIENKEARAVNSRLADTTVLREPTTNVPMATPSIAELYPNSGDSQSAKERPYFTVAELEKFFETCPPDLVPFKYLRLLHGMWLSTDTKLHGGDIRFFKAVEDYRKGCRYKSPTSVRCNLRGAERLGFLEVVYRDEFGKPHHLWVRKRTESDRGDYRKVTTYRLSVSLLMKWRERQRCGHAEVTPIRKPSLPTPPPPPPAPAAPLPKREQPAAKADSRSEHRSTERSSSPRRITRDERLVLFTAYIALKKSGKSHEAALDEVARQYDKQFAREDIEFAVKVVATKKADRDGGNDERDYRNLTRELKLLRADAGAHRSPESSFRLACDRAGITEARGTELWERMNSPGQSS
jgi:hypothetical protein